jgi:glucose-1-phosphate thymidylyltransferase
MNIIIPMAGMGKRLRPHTLTNPKPLFPIAGKPIVHRLVEDIANVIDEPINEIAFITGRFGEQVEKDLIQIAEKLGAKGSIYYQDTPLGTAHAIYMAEKALTGRVTVAFADTLFFADFKIDTNQQGTIWTKKIENPEQFGVVQKDAEGYVINFVEKPKEFVSDEAIIGIYYFADGDMLRNEIKHLLDNNIVVKGEYQLTDALENMKQKGVKFTTATVSHWLDCGNKAAVLDSNYKVLTHNPNAANIHSSAEIINSTIHQPVFIAEGVKIENSIIGPHVSIGSNSHLRNTIIQNSIIMNNATAKNIVLENSVLGNHSTIDNQSQELNLGDYSQF